MLILFALFSTICPPPPHPSNLLRIRFSFYARLCVSSNISCFHGMCSLHKQKCWVLWCTLALLKIKHYLCIQKNFSTVLANSEHVVEKCFCIRKLNWDDAQVLMWALHFRILDKNRITFQTLCESFTFTNPMKPDFVLDDWWIFIFFWSFHMYPASTPFIRCLKLFPLSSKYIWLAPPIWFSDRISLYRPHALLFFGLMVCIGICWNVLCIPQALHKN